MNLIEFIIEYNKSDALIMPFVVDQQWISSVIQFRTINAVKNSSRLALHTSVCEKVLSVRLFCIYFVLLEKFEVQVRFYHETTCSEKNNVKRQSFSSTYINVQISVYYRTWNSPVYKKTVDSKLWFKSVEYIVIHQKKMQVLWTRFIHHFNLWTLPLNYRNLIS